MKNFMALLIVSTLTYVEFKNIGINPGPRDTVTLMIDDDCKIQVNAQAALNDYQAIECAMLKQCFGEKDPIECH